jgi:hypothetical protein
MRTHGSARWPSSAGQPASHTVCGIRSSVNPSASMTTMESSKLLTEKEAAAELGIAISGLRKLRYAKRIPFIRVSYRCASDSIWPRCIALCAKWRHPKKSAALLGSSPSQPSRDQSSGMHRSGDISLEDLTWQHPPWNGAAAYADSKLHDVLLAFAVARRLPEVLSNALEPGCVPTKMGSPGAPNDLDARARGLSADVPAALSEPGAGTGHEGLLADCSLSL